MSGARPSRAQRTLPQRIAGYLAILALVLMGAYLFDYWRARSSADLVPWGDGLDAAFATAQAEGKPVLLLSAASWCPPCQLMKREVFADPDAARQIADRFVPVRFLDGQTSEAQRMTQQQLGVTGYPTLIVLSPDGERLGAMSGYSRGGGDRLLDWLAQVAADHRYTAR